MASFFSSDIVLVTGGNGHIASSIIKHLLQRGPAVVRATVRTEKAAEPLRTHFASYVDAQRLEIVFVPDITVPEAFKDVVDGITYIAHVASSVLLDEGDPEREVLLPAINGTTGVLKAAAKSSTLKAVVITSSVGAIHQPNAPQPGFVFTEDTWSPMTHEQAARRVKIPGLLPQFERWIPYSGSKKLAEKAAWDFFHEMQKQGATWRLSTILPSFVAGPSAFPPRGSDGLASYSVTQKILTTLAMGGLPQEDPDDWPFWVHIDEVVEAHLQALLLPEASGRRWLLAPLRGDRSQLNALILKCFPETQIAVPPAATFPYRIETKPAYEELKLARPRSLEDCVKDTLEPVIDRLRAGGETDHVGHISPGERV